MRRKWIVFSLIVLLLSTALGSAFASEGLQVHYLDVGQAESTVLMGQGFTILIDAGDRGETDVLYHLHRLGIETIDLLILTHPHADHIGQAAQILDSFAVREVWMSGYEHYTVLFETVLDAILDSDADYYEPRAGEKFSFGQLNLEIVNPTEIGSDLHDTCIMVRAVYGDIAFLFTGDAERKTETKLSRMGVPLKAQILQLGHHGSRTSSSLDFLLDVDPEVVIYSAGVGNDYGHPHPEVINRLKILKVPVYGTDRYGTIVVNTDGTNYSIEVSKLGEIKHFCVDINTASVEELQRIIHIGPALAQEIVRQREIHPFKSIEELKRVSGIGEKRLADIKSEGLACVKGVVEN
ncbi:MAG: MBL fold metallo-hydrolase [Firmicutes bacterium]|jgi:competence ComEA-like helix-hairpin-helix protein|nr:MBL fold metallo-hydrolase [Bacillota bacterium]